MRLLQPGLTPHIRERTRNFSKWLLSVGNGETGVPDAEDPLKSRWKAIVCPKNDAADTINTLIVDMVDGPVTTYYSYDTATPHGNDGAESELLYPTEYLNTLNYPGLPPHTLHLKKGVPAILLRNINIAGGLCNGTRMIITQKLSKSAEAEIITGTRVGEKGQSLNKIGVYLPKPIFGHCQLYVAIKGYITGCIEVAN
ncbi:uncharacterized protein [Rutidosis leptorrhynchoides]|uniref:uncharacterized protein n=1 Tax=Rutidosis leptorrhynchoides TaxID=125765 RepID=UPI003A9974CA